MARIAGLSLSAFVAGALWAGAGSVQAAVVLYADARLDFQMAPAGQSTAHFNAGTGLSDSLGTGRWNYYSSAGVPGSGANTLLTVGPAGNAGQSMYRDALGANGMPVVSDRQIWSNVAPPGPGYIQLHAGRAGHDSALMRWTAGANQATDGLHVQGSITHGIALGTARFDIHVNGVPQYSQVLTDTTPHYFNLAGLSVAPGQHVDFYLYNNADGDGGDIANLAAWIDAGPAWSQPVWSQYFNTLAGGSAGAGPQYQTGLPLRVNASLAGWNKSGGGTVHAVEHSPGDWAPMFWAGDPNVLTLQNGIAANELGVPYEVLFDIAPAVYHDGVQATADGDAVRIELLTDDNSILAYYDSEPGAWAGEMAFRPDSFNYFGDGTGDIRVQIGPVGSFPRFAGAIDNLRIAIVPEPSAVMLAFTALAGLLCRRRRKRV